MCSSGQHKPVTTSGTFQTWGACGLLQRTGLRPARLQAEKNVFPGKAGKNMI